MTHIIGFCQYRYRNAILVRQFNECITTLYGVLTFFVGFIGLCIIGIFRFFPNSIFGRIKKRRAAPNSRRQAWRSWLPSSQTAMPADWAATWAGALASNRQALMEQAEAKVRIRDMRSPFLTG